MAVATVLLFGTDSLLSGRGFSYDQHVAVEKSVLWAYAALCIVTIVVGTTYAQRGDEVAPFVVGFCVLTLLVIGMGSCLPTGIVM